MVKYVINYTGPGYSINKAYAQNQWQRRTTKKEYQAIFYDLIDKLSPGQPLTKFKLKVKFNARIETSNNVAMEKILVDCLRYRKVIENDSNKMMWKVTYQHCPEYPANTFKFIVKGTV